MLRLLVCALCVLCTSAITTVHIGNDEALIFRSGLVNPQRHRLRHTLLGASCDLVLFPAQIVPIEWRDVFSNASISDVEIVGLSKQVLVEYNRRSGQYVLRRCDGSSNSNPCPVYASGVDPNLSPSRSFFHAGPHRVLLYDTNGSYQMLFFDEDVHGSGAVFHQYEGSIFSGQFSFSGNVDFVYLRPENSEQEFMVSFHRLDGSFTMWTYNSTARNHEQMFGVAVATGSLAAQRGTVAKAFGESDVIIYNERSARFQVHRLVMRSPDSLEMTTLTRGNLTYGFGCEAITSVRECVRTPTCGWCESDGGCHQLSGHTNGRFIEFCDGKLCSVPDPKELPPSVRIPQLNIPKGEGSVQLSVPLSVREYLDSLENDPDPAAVNQQNEESVIEWAAQGQSISPLTATAPTQTVQKFYVPPPNIALYCMDHPQAANCSRFEMMARAEQAVKSDALQPTIVPDDDGEAISSHPGLDAVTDEDMENSGTRGPHQPTPVDDTVSSGKMEKGTAPCAASHAEGNTKAEIEMSQSSELMHSAMNNAQNARPALILELIPDAPGAGISGGHTQSPTVSPTPSTSPSPSETPSTSVSITPSPSPSPSMRSHPCPEVGVVVRDELNCARCEVYNWTPFQPETHLTRKIDPDCVVFQLLSQTATPNTNTPVEHSPQISEAVLKLTWKANPPPPPPSAPQK
eukprot:c9888_g1_i1.p1 GENE.c9888_g1_i1~~c9888_g1_i1.p1  ORF type:complete len:686 (+),score=200.66 c9888_g1_i1:44-2101(+)